jgi:glutaredoxin
VPDVIVTLLSKPGCHLCDDARPIVQEVVAQFDAATLVERSILETEELHTQYWDQIPVVLIDDRVHTIYRVDADRLRAALAERSS